jgi:trigger factor
MKVTVKKSEGLYHEFAIQVPADQIQTFIQARLKEIGKKVKVDGFRPGKAPMALLEKRYGESARVEALDKAVEDCTFKALKEKEIKPAMRPKVDVTKFDNDNVLEFTVIVETMPNITPSDLAKITIEKPVAPIDEAEVKDALNRIAANYKVSQALATPRAAKMGDTVKMNFDGSSHGKKLPGMSAKGFELELGSNMFVDTFEEQLVGVNNGDKKTINVNFPADYRHPDLAGQPATFEVEVLEVCESVVPAIDDALAEKVGMKTLKDLDDAIRGQMQSEHDRLSRAKVKRALLDALDKANQFDVPQGMVDEEFEQIWNYHLQDVKKRGLDVAEAQKDEDTKKEFREISERRVRLGLLMSEIGEQNKIQVTNQELQQAIIREAYNYRGQEQEVIKYYQKNPQAVAALRAPIFEEKVTDYILSKITLNEKSVSKEELARDPDDEAEEARVKKATKKK